MNKPTKSKPDANIELADRALGLIVSKAEGVLQSDLRKMLAIDSSKCSRIVSRLELQGHICRERFSLGGSRTYLLKSTARPAARPSARPAQRHSQPDYGQSDNCKPDHSWPKFRQPEYRQGDFLGRNIDSYLTEIYLLYLIRDAARPGERPCQCR
jgi:Lrp/AsnC family transcriptional regulator, leucine-responsive regulatory protein